MIPAVVQSTSSSSLAATAMTAGGRERSGGAEQDDRRGRCPEPPQADVHAAVEEDHDQRDDGDPLDRADRDVLLQVGEEGRDTTAAPSRNSAGAGTGDPLVTRMETSASENPPAR